MKSGTTTGPLSAVKKSAGFAGVNEPHGRMAQLDAQEARERKTVPERKLDKVTALLNDPTFVTCYTWPFLNWKVGGKDRQLYVSRYYFRKMLALDMFQEGEPDPKEIAFKQQAFKAAGIKYFALTPSKKLSDLAAYLGE